MEYELVKKSSLTVDGVLVVRGQNVDEEVYSGLDKRKKAFFKKVENGEDLQQKPLSKYNKKELLDFAKENYPDLQVDNKMTNKEIVAAIEAAEKAAAEQQNGNDGNDDGDGNGSE